MSASTVVIILILVVGTASIWRSHVSAKRNRNGLCAKCSEVLQRGGAIVVRAGGQNYLYCQSCGGGVRLRDRMFWAVFLLLIVSFVGGYFVLK